MQYWVAVNGQKYGPIELDQLLEMNISPEVFVWREGLTTWIKAKDLSELSAIFAQHVEVTPPALPQDGVEAESAPLVDTVPYNAPPPTVPYENQNCNQPQQPVMPPNYLAWSIITMLCCCQVFGIVALIYSVQVSSLHAQGKYIAAEKASSNARMWIIVSVVTALILTPIVVALSMLGEMADYLV